MPQLRFKELLRGLPGPWIIVGLIACIVILIFALRSCVDDLVGPVAGVETTIVRQIDTVIRVEQAPPVVVRQVETRVVWRDRALVAQIDSSRGFIDTVLICEPFRARFDTTVDGVQVRGTIAYPPLALAELAMTMPPDTLRDVHETLTVSTATIRAPPWYQQVGTVLLSAGVGFAAGYVTGRLTAPGGDPPPRAAAGAPMARAGPSPALYISFNYAFR